MNPSLFWPHDARRLFLVTFGVTLLIKLWLAAYFPITGDEAYFVQWGTHPEWGFYDHPPMIGWLLSILLHISSHPLALRIVTVLLWNLIALGMIDLMLRLQPDRREAAWLMGTAFLTLPFTWALNIVTNDTPLIFFVFFSAYCFIRATLSRTTAWYVLSGTLLGLALLSKYFAGLLAIAYVVYFLACERNRYGIKNVLLVAFSALPFAAINVAYNATHCWNNIMFNMYNRNESATLSLLTVGIYLAMMLYLLTPWFSLKLLRNRPTGKKETLLFLLFFVPFLIFLLLSLKKTIGLHWVLAFLPFVFLFAAVKLEAQFIRQSIKWGVGLSIPHFMILAALILLPVSVWEGSSLHNGIVFHKETSSIVSALRKDAPDGTVLMASSYTPAAILAFHANEYIPVFGTGTHHARQDDTITDFRAINGKPVRIFDRAPINPEQFAPYFSAVRTGFFDIAGVRYWYADGTGFNYSKYRATVLTTIANRYYKIPDFLPKCGCDFLDKYEL